MWRDAVWPQQLQFTRFGLDPVSLFKALFLQIWTGADLPFSQVELGLNYVPVTDLYMPKYKSPWQNIKVKCSSCTRPNSHENRYSPYQINSVTPAPALTTLS